MKNIYTIQALLLIVITSHAALAQSNVRNSLIIQPRTYGTITEIDLRDISVTEASSYLYDDWLEGDVILRNGRKIGKYPLRYDLKNNLLEIRVEDEIKLLEAIRISKISWYNLKTLKEEEFFNSSGINFNNSYLKGFLKGIETSGNWKLYSLTKLELKKANYVPALDAGVQYDEYFQSTKYYISDLESIYELPNRSRPLSTLLNKIGGGGEWSKFAKNNKLKGNDEKGLIKLINFIN